MVAAYHLIWTIYGYWLPNDPRGSSSRTIRCDVLRELGEIHYGRKRIQPASKDLREFYARAKAVLKHAVIEFSDAEIGLLAREFGDVISKHQYTCYGCAILPDHVHLLIRKHRDLAEQMIVNVQASTQLLFMDQRLRPGDHPVWGGAGWKVYLDTASDIERTIRYIAENPIRARPRAALGFRQKVRWLVAGRTNETVKRSAKPPSELHLRVADNTIKF